MPQFCGRLFAFSVFMLLIGQQEEHPASKKTRVE